MKASKTSFAPPPAPQLKPGADAFVAGADTRQPSAPVASAPAAIKNEEPVPAAPIQMIRLTTDLEPDLHRRLKIKAMDATAQKGKTVSMADLVRGWIAEKCAE